MMASSSAPVNGKEIEIEHPPPEWWISMIETKHAEEQGTSSKSPPIYKLQRVPMTLREIEKNKECYDPTVVSFGPFHHGHPKLQAVEKLKPTIAQKFISGRDTRKFYQNFVEVSHKARGCYAEGSTDAFNDEEFMRMLFLDGCFLLYFIDCAVRGRLEDMKMKDHQIAFVLRDMFLLENQLPFVVLQALMTFRLTDGQRIIRKFIGRLSGANSSSQEYDHPPHQEHGHPPPQEHDHPPHQEHGLPPPQEHDHPPHQEHGLPPHQEHDHPPHQEHGHPRNQEHDHPPHQEHGHPPHQEHDHPPHLLHLLWNEFVGGTPSPKIWLFTQKEGHFFHPFRSVQELRAAGIMFKKSTNSTLRSVSFVPHHIHGDLLLPAVLVDQSTKTMFLNLVAYEASPDASSDFAITSYICLLESLIANADDVKELRSKNIIFNFLGGDQEVADLFHDLVANLVPNSTEYREVKLLIENHYRRKMNFVPVMLYKLYKSFSGRWTLFVYIMTLVLMVIFIVQTYFTVFPLKG